MKLGKSEDIVHNLVGKEPTVAKFRVYSSERDSVKTINQQESRQRNLQSREIKIIEFV